MYSLIRLHGKGYTYLHAITPDKKPRLLTFSSEEKANNFKEGVVRFHKRFHMWPPITLHEQHAIDVSKYKQPYDEITDYDKVLDIETVDEDTILKYMVCGNLAVFNCVDFTFSPSLRNSQKIDMRFRAQEMTLEEQVYEDYVNSLEFNLMITDTEDYI